MDSDEGYFPRGTSMLRRVMKERCVGTLYGQRALCIGALKPLNYVGTTEHSHHLATPFKRFARTATMFERVYFGGLQEADATLAAVAGMHHRVNGQLPEDEGPRYPAGTRYDAFDPQLMLWTMGNLVDSSTWFYERLVRSLSDEERESLWRDWLRFGELFGLARQHMPRSYPAFSAWFSEQLAGDDLYLSPEARYMGYVSAFEIPMPASRQPYKKAHDALMLYSLPERVRTLYGLRLDPAAKHAAQLTIALHRRLRPLIPAHVATGSCVGSFKMVARTERQRIELGRHTPNLAERRPRATG
jgi:uncharacterized protein (DUF2236 family)